MFISSIISLVVTFASDHTRSLNFWTLGSFSGVNYGQAKLLALALALCGGVILRYSHELNAFAVGEDNARHVGVNVKRVKLVILITVSALIGVCVSIRTLFSPIELSIGVVTSLVGAVAFVIIFYRTRKAR